MPSNYPMYIPEDMKPLWRAQARKDGFITLAAWIRWLANNRCMEEPNKREPQNDRLNS